LNLAMMTDWAFVARHLWNHQPFMFLIVGLFTGIACFGIMNAIIGVIVSRTAQAAKEAEAEDLMSFRLRQMAFVENVRDVIYEIDADGDGTVSPEEIAEASDNEALLDALASVDLPTGFSMLELHCMLDKDGDGELTKFEFGQGMKRLIFSNDFQRQCLLQLAMAQQKRKMHEFRLSVEEELASLKQAMDQLPDRLMGRFADMLDKHVPKYTVSSEQGDKIISNPSTADRKDLYSPKGSPFGNELNAGNLPGSVGGSEIQAKDNSWATRQPNAQRLRAPSPTAQATAVALAEVSTALAVAAQNWGEGMDPFVGGMNNSPLRNAGAASRPGGRGGFGALHPGIVNQHVAQVPNQMFNHGRQMQNPNGLQMTGGNQMPGNQIPGNTAPSIPGQIQANGHGNPAEGGGVQRGRRGLDMVNASVV